MKFLTYRLPDGPPRPGVLEGTLIRTLGTQTLRAYVELAPTERIAWHTGDDLVALDDVMLEAPIRPPRNVFCVGRNYLEHAREGARTAGRELRLPSVPTFFTKATTAVASPNATLQFDRRVSREYDFEAELAVIIGARCKDVTEAAAPDVVFGYTILNDLTARDLQREHGQWFKGKSLDDSCPIGPWIVTPDEIGDPQALGIRLWCNGVEKQNATTAEMIFTVPRIIAELSKGMTLLPGDVIATGTPAGVGFARQPPEFISDGDTIDVEIERIGTLHNTIAVA